MSREIDRKVAEIVLGPWDESRCRVCGWPVVPEGEFGCWASNCSMRPVPNRRADEDPHYSTDIAAAIGALVEFSKGGWGWSIGLGDDGYYCVTAFTREPSYADTIPLAICAAILAAHTAAGEGE